MTRRRNARQLICEVYGKGRFHGWTSQRAWAKVKYVRSVAEPDNPAAGTLTIVYVWGQRKNLQSDLVKPHFSNETIEDWKGFVSSVCFIDSLCSSCPPQIIGPLERSTSRATPRSERPVATVEGPQVRALREVRWAREIGPGSLHPYWLVARCDSGSDNTTGKLSLEQLRYLQPTCEHLCPNSGSNFSVLNSVV